MAVARRGAETAAGSPIHLEQQHDAPATINLRLAAVRRVAYEAADAGLLSPELAAGIRRVKGVRRLGVWLGNWLTPEQGRRLLTHRTPQTPRELRDHAMLAVLIGCGLRRGEWLALDLASVQREEPGWVKAAVEGHVSIQTTERYLGCKQKLRHAVNDRLGIEPDAA